MWRPAIKHIPEDESSYKKKKSKASLESQLAFAGVALAIGLVLAALGLVVVARSRGSKRVPDAEPPVLRLHGEPPVPAGRLDVAPEDYPSPSSDSPLPVFIRELPRLSKY